MQVYTYSHKYYHGVDLGAYPTDLPSIRTLVEISQAFPRETPGQNDSSRFDGEGTALERRRPAYTDDRFGS